MKMHHHRSSNFAAAIAICAIVCSVFVPLLRLGAAVVAEQTANSDHQSGSDCGFVTRRGAKLFLNGKEYRAIGVNIPHLHQAYFGTWFHNGQIYGTPEKARQAMVDAITDAEKSGIAFIRFFASPGYPIDTEKLYGKDPARYWRNMDELFALCHKHRLRLVPSLGGVRQWHQYCGEPAQAILDPKSKTSATTRKYITEFVTRYKDDPTVLMWELENESMIAADVDAMNQNLLPAALFPADCPPTRTKGVREDSLTWGMTLRIYRELVVLIKGLDSHHMVESGDSGVRVECTSRRETFPNFKYRSDTWDEYLANTLASQPDPLDLYSLHWAGSDKSIGQIERAVDNSWKDKLFMDVFRQTIRAVHAANKPMYIGEISQQEPGFQDDPQAKWTRKFFDMMEAEGVSLASIWVWHFPWQPKLTVSSATHPELVKRVAEFNRKYAHRGAAE